MRRYWTISLAIGGGAALVSLALLLGGVFEAAAARLGEFYESRGWFPQPGPARLRWLEIPLAALAGLGSAAALVECSRPSQKASVAALILGAATLLSPAFALHGALLDPSAPLVAALLGIVGAAFFGTTEWGRRKRLLEDALGARVSARVWADLLESPLPPAFGGVEREASVVACRLFPPGEGRSSPSPEDALRLGGLFQRTVTAFLLSRGAYLEDAGPERVRAVFGLLRDEPDHAARACRAALELRGRLRGLAKECETLWFLEPGWGIGVASGRMVAGLCGQAGGAALVGIGGGGDFADRLALANRRYRSDLLVSAATWRMVREAFEVRPLEMLYDPEALRLEEVYQLLAEAGGLTEDERARRDAFWRGVLRLRAKEWEAALEELSRARVPGGGDDAPLARLISEAQEAVAGPSSRPLRLVRDLVDEGHARPFPHL
jgi:hypothetical protein